ncbi:MAG TPA: pantetheine-phosphate adenylyltransferase [Planctomycetota bacterium]|jgi:pantetheine-phosphate adenylyltransferase|nr:pantetheine-phosphate adenylyltransferase [Planctomycetota bacterium]OQC22262.1 MAG: Phosphopantetheine adenylyltransferase [Planctomycetes bacterium ADurb.Bin069]NMD35797.1 pantetheine-phosphate adenylyltransferase [Planctomycetota bacterium]HNS00145.1 pantetheine-phosphate adenylyltransferase [Planctomycetota bacterium]HNU25903.1 pantetheine-phosphate adenylyltransferase [Planctomycetota bacterium]
MGTCRRKALFPGTFDPPTCGHREIIAKAAPLFDELIVAVGVNPDKRPMFTAKERVRLLERIAAPLGRVRAASYTGLTADFARAEGALAIVRGLRSCEDLAAERDLALGNEALGAGLPTIFFLTTGTGAQASSKLVRALIAGGDVQAAEAFVPEEARALLRAFVTRRLRRAGERRGATGRRD